MFALLFDRKSGILTLLALGTIGVMLFAAGLVIGVHLSWDRLASHLPRMAQAVPAVSPATAPDSGSGTAPAVSAWARPRNASPAEPAEPAAFPRREPAAPPPGWVPLADGAPWPGAAGEEADASHPSHLSQSSHPSDTAGLSETAEPSPRMEQTATASAPAAAETGSVGSHYFVQAGAFPDEAGAEEMRTGLLARCHGKPYQPFLETVWDRYGRRLVAVRIGPLASEASALEVANGLNGSLIGWSSGHRTL
jgi:SPOR domain